MNYILSITVEATLEQGMHAKTRAATCTKIITNE